MTLDPLLRTWRYRIFAATWLSYAGFYFCRKPFYIVKSSLGEAQGWDASTLGTIGMVYLLAYTVGQFLAGAIGSRLGPRLLLLLGMAISIGVNVLFGVTNSLALFLALMALNGLAQATGWSANVGTMAQWFTRSERGSVMGLWATNFQVGGVLANTLAAYALGTWGFRYSFFVGALVLLAVWTFGVLNLRNKPEDVGLVPLTDPQEIEPIAGGPVLSRAAWTNVLLVGTFYFFVKFIRYALWSWAPFFLERNYGLAGDDAGYLSTVFDVAGVAGVIVTGFLSDRLFQSRRAGVSLLMMVAMSLGCVLLQVMGDVSVTVFTVAIGIVGFSLYGPDALMTGAGAMDIGSRRGALLAAGVINGMGSLGSVVQEVAIGKLYDEGEGLGPIFGLLLASALLATLMMAIVTLRNRLGRSNV